MGSASRPDLTPASRLCCRAHWLRPPNHTDRTKFCAPRNLGCNDRLRFDSAGCPSPSHSASTSSRLTGHVTGQRSCSCGQWVRLRPGTRDRQGDPRGRGTLSAVVPVVQGLEMGVASTWLCLPRDRARERARAVLSHWSDCSFIHMRQRALQALRGFEFIYMGIYRKDTNTHLHAPHKTQ